MISALASARRSTLVHPWPELPAGPGPIQAAVQRAYKARVGEAIGVLPSTLSYVFRPG